MRKDDTAWSEELSVGLAVPDVPPGSAAEPPDLDAPQPAPPDLTDEGSQNAIVFATARS